MTLSECRIYCFIIMFYTSLWLPGYVYTVAQLCVHVSQLFLFVQPWKMLAHKALVMDIYGKHDFVEQDSWVGGLHSTVKLILQLLVFVNTHCIMYYCFVNKMWKPQLSATFCKLMLNIFIGQSKHYFIIQ